jgi:hypothetical protein
VWPAEAPSSLTIDPSDDCLIARVYGCACLTSWAAASAWARAVAANGNGGCAAASLLLLDQQQPSPGIRLARQQACDLVVACMASCVCWKRQHCRTLSDELETQPGQDKVCGWCLRGLAISRISTWRHGQGPAAVRTCRCCHERVPLPSVPPPDALLNILPHLLPAAEHQVARQPQQRGVHWQRVWRRGRRRSSCGCWCRRGLHTPHPGWACQR